MIVRNLALWFAVGGLSGSALAQTASVDVVEEGRGLQRADEVQYASYVQPPDSAPAAPQLSSSRLLAGIREYPDAVVKALLTLAENPDLIRRLATEPALFDKPDDLGSVATAEIRAALDAVRPIPDVVKVAAEHLDSARDLRGLYVDAPEGLDARLKELRRDYLRAATDAAGAWQRMLASDPAALGEYRTLLDAFCKEQRSRDEHFPVVYAKQQDYYFACPPDAVLMEFAISRSPGGSLARVLESWYSDYGPEERDAALLREGGGLAVMSLAQQSGGSNSVAAMKADVRRAMWTAESAATGTLGAIPVVLQPLADQPIEARLAFAMYEHMRLWTPASTDDGDDFDDAGAIASAAPAPQPVQQPMQAPMQQQPVQQQPVQQQQSQYVETQVNEEYITPPPSSGITYEVRDAEPVVIADQPTTVYYDEPSTVYYEQPAVVYTTAYQDYDDYIVGGYYNSYYTTYGIGYGYGLGYAGWPSYYCPPYYRPIYYPYGYGYGYGYGAYGYGGYGYYGYRPSWGFSFGFGYGGHRGYYSGHRHAYRSLCGFYRSSGYYRGGGYRPGVSHHRGYYGNSYRNHRSSGGGSGRYYDSARQRIGSGRSGYSRNGEGRGNYSQRGSFGQQRDGDRTRSGSRGQFGSGGRSGRSPQTMNSLRDGVGRSRTDGARTRDFSNTRSGSRGDRQSMQRSPGRSDDAARRSINRAPRSQSGNAIQGTRDRSNGVRNSRSPMPSIQNGTPRSNIRSTPRTAPSMRSGGNRSSAGSAPRMGGNNSGSRSLAPRSGGSSGRSGMLRPGGGGSPGPRSMSSGRGGSSAGPRSIGRSPGGGGRSMGAAPSRGGGRSMGAAPSRGGGGRSMGAGPSRGGGGRRGRP